MAGLAARARRSALGLAAASWLAATAGVAGAHHSLVGSYDAKRIVTVKGVVTSVNYRNPHIFFTLSVVADGGGVVVWTVETESIPATGGKGLRQGDLSVGGRVSVTGWPARDGSPAMGARSITLPGGRTIQLRRSAR